MNFNRFNFAPYWTRTAEFKALQDLWYKKLRETGFRDIETTRSIKRHYIISPSISNLYEFYFEECRSYYHTNKIEDPLDNHIFFQYSMGLSNEAIAMSLPDFGFPKRDRSTVSRRLRKLLLAAGLPVIEFNSKLG